MTRHARRLTPVYKEVRALLFPWVACIVLLVLPRAVDLRMTAAAILIYFAGAAALGAMALGRDYTDGTLSLTLSLPVRRERLLIVKQAVLAAMLLSLMGAVSLWLRGVADPRMSTPLWVRSIPILYGFFLAPWLTLLCRNPVAGTVFTIAIPGTLWVAAEWIGVMLYGYGPQMYAFRVALFWSATLALCAVGFAATWRLFLKLEAIEGPGRDLGVTGWFGSARHPIALLVLKELNLQQLAIVLGVLNLLGWMVLTMTLSDSPLLDAFTAISVFVAAVIAVLIGATASAGERQLGTHEWQVMMPVASSTQWAVKAGVAIILALLLTVALPAFYAYLHPGLHPRQLLRPMLAVLITLVTAGSLYVSSLCRTALWALLMSLIATFAAAMWAEAVMRAMASSALRFPSSTAMSIAIAATIVPVLWFAHVNHRRADRSVATTWPQVITIVGIFTAGTVAVMRAI